MSGSGEYDESMSFWQHLEVLRKVLWKALFAVVVIAVAAFVFKDALFSMVFAPSRGDFVTYRLLCRLAELTGWHGLCASDFQAAFINTELAAQFMTHVKVSLWTGVCLASPYIIYLLYGFVAPALYEKEKRYSGIVIFSSVALFVAGVLLNYFVIFPFSFRFLSMYQVQPEVVNQIALSSYISTFLLLSLLLGVMFELPVLAYILAKMGVLRADALRKYRKHAFVGICILAAVITPTGDAVTLMIVTLPVYLLYELSIAVVGRVEKKRRQNDSV